MATTIKYYEVSYTKKVGGEGKVTVKARNEKEALANASFNVFTGKDFKVVGEVAQTKDTVKGPGRNRMN
jgi:hypothetical protein